MGLHTWMPAALRGTAVLLVSAAIVLTGCDGFFVPTCEEQNNCTTTTTTTGTDTGTGTGTDTGTGTGTGTGTDTGTGTGTAPGGVGTGTGTQSSASASPTVFVANAVTGKIAAFSTGAEGIQPRLPTVSTPGAPPIAVAATPDSRQLFALTSSGTILLYTISPDGSLQPANGGQSLEKVPNAVSMTIAPSGSLLFVASSSPAVLHVFEIQVGKNGDAALVPAPEASFALDAGQPTQIQVAPDNSHIAVALGPGGVDLLALDAESGVVSGRVHLEPLHGGKDAYAAFGEGSRILYVAETGAGIRALTLGPSGSSDEIAGSPFARDAGDPSSLVFQPSSNILYAAYPGTRGIVSYSADASGALSKISSTSYIPQGTSTALSLDAGGRRLLAVASDTSSTLQGLNIGPDGKLQASTSSGTGAAQ